MKIKSTEDFDSRISSGVFYDLFVDSRGLDGVRKMWIRDNNGDIFFVSTKSGNLNSNWKLSND